MLFACIEICSKTLFPGHLDFHEKFSRRFATKICHVFLDFLRFLKVFDYREKIPMFQLYNWSFLCSKNLWTKVCMIFHFWYLIWPEILRELLEKNITLYMPALVIEKQMNKYCSKTEVFKHCEIDSGFCMNRTHPVEFVVKPEENLSLCQNFQNGISYLVLNFFLVSQRLDKSVKWISRHSK